MLPRYRVRLLDVPVGLFLAAEQHQNDLLREIALMAAAANGLERGHQFADLLAAADRTAHRPTALRRRIGESVAVAVRAGWDTVTVDVEADEGAASGALEWEELLARFDSMSRDEQLLTLPADPELAAYRRWIVGEIVDQVRGGRGPRSWRAARASALAGAGC